MHFKSDGDRDFFLEFRLLLHLFCLLDSLVVCMVTLMFAETKESNMLVYLNCCKGFNDVYIGTLAGHIFDHSRYTSTSCKQKVWNMIVTYFRVVLFKRLFPINIPVS